LASRRGTRQQNNEKAKDNLRWLHANTHAHMHVDLIAGLPGESLASFGEGFDTLARLGPHEIQVGVLKRLRGTPIIRHTEAFAMRYNPEPPYNILSNNELSFADVQRVNRFARFWDLIGNSGRFTNTLPLILQEAPTSAFSRFMALADWLYAETGATHQIALERLFDLVYRWLHTDGAVAPELTVADDSRQAGRHATPARQRRHLPDKSEGGTTAPVHNELG